MRKSRLVIIMLIMLIQIILVSCNTDTDNLTQEKIIDKNKAMLYKQDYIQACEIIANQYIYLEEKLHMSSEEFLNMMKNHEESIIWTGEKKQFISEIRELLAKFPDGHMEWSIDRSMFINNKGMGLGIVLTVDKDEKIIIGKVLEHLSEDIKEGDEVIEINGNPPIEEIMSFSKINPQSTKAANMEVGARRYTVEYPIMPLRDELNDVILKIKKQDESIKEVVLSWRECPMTMTINGPENELLLTKNFKPSLEELPKDMNYKNNSLIYYFREINNKNIAILHPRDFANWNQEDLRYVFKEILKKSPDLLVLDLKDTAGGYLDQVLYLSHALGITKEFKYTLNTIDKDTHKPTSTNENLNNIEEKIQINNLYTGPVILRINSICASGSDYFPRWFQLNDRGKIVGMPTGGAGGGTNQFKLTNTKTTISVPLRDRILIDDIKSIEGNSVIPDIIDDRNLIDIITDEVGK